MRRKLAIVVAGALCAAVVAVVIAVEVVVTGTFAASGQNTVTAVTPLNCPAASYGATTPTDVQQVPRVLPCNGVNVDNQVVLLPAAPVPGALTSSQAITAARQFEAASSKPITVVLASITPPASIPPAGTNAPAHVVSNHPVWVVTFVLSQPMNPDQGGVHHTAVNLVTHDNVAVDATTGAFVLGFFTD